jgi:2-polyprenyl-6-methoxyphenol hydroxylase-like FAD-dependent oxidoreductase
MYRIRKKEVPVTTSNLNQIPLQDEVLVLGGGVAGCAASIALARKGRVVTLIERDGLNNPLARAVLLFCLRVWPGVMRVTARLTRVAQHAIVAYPCSRLLKSSPAKTTLSRQNTIGQMQ